MAKSTKFSLKLLVDEKRNKVVLAEASQDFVDVLYGLLTLPMGTIARLLEKHQKLPQVLCCYKNLNKSVADVVVDDFETEACKSMLMYPKSTKEIHCRRLKLNIDDTTATKFFVCSNVHSCKSYSNFSTSRCKCGYSMVHQVQVPEEEQCVDGLFVSCRSSFIITDDLKVRFNSIDGIVEVVSGLGYSCLSDLREMLADVGFDEVFTLLANVFTSESPLTCAFLRKHCVTRMDKPLSPVLTTGRVEQATRCYVKVFVRKLDRKIIYAECSEDFVDSLLTFLVFPLELAASFSNDNTILGCVRNLCRGGNCLTFIVTHHKHTNVKFPNVIHFCAITNFPGGLIDLWLGKMKELLL
ncbi:hypothetical protein EUTSA_v10009971mg [Eutrema salsugineum]|uniref:DUF674 domain-containing protein n=1 Tax=Eutrema salsugineum TaxID=72664 RepID=V4K7J4_EUTSA|nr:hypothetical protein EUTSA_v10009971mg [Eutrema salsugineum]